MEDCEALNPDNDIHIYALHFVFLPRINNALDKFVAAWNCHGVSTAGNRTPVQLWMLGMNSVAQSNLTVAKETFAEVTDFVLTFNFSK